MLVQLNRQPGVHDFSATATDLPINPARLPRNSGPLPVVAVLGHSGRVAGLPWHLPGGWSLRPVAGLADVRPEEIVLIAGADVCVRGGRPAILAGHLVAAHRRRLADRWSRLDEQARR